MKAPQEKAAGYTAVCVIAVILLWWIVFSIIGGIVGRSIWGGMGAPGTTVSSTGGFEDDSAGKALEQWGKQIEAAGKQVEKSAEQGSRITGSTGKSVDGERDSAGSVVARKRSNVRGAKRPCCL